MLRPFTIKPFCLLTLLVLLCGAGHAAVTNTSPANLALTHGSVLYIPLILSSDQALAGLNGELDYDATIFDAPQITAGPGLGSTFNVLGNTPVAGQFKFVIYSNPTTTLATDTPIAYFAMELLPTYHASTMASLNFGSAAAGNAQGTGLDTALTGYSVSINGNAARDWAVYE